jgi:hypothetical protein
MLYADQMRAALTREEKEALYQTTMTELQTRWKNPINGDWNFIKQWTDDELEKELTGTISQLRFEKGLATTKQVISIPVYVFIALGTLGLLLFGIKELFKMLRAFWPST